MPKEDLVVSGWFAKYLDELQSERIEVEVGGASKAKKGLDYEKDISIFWQRLTKNSLPSQLWAVI